MSAPTPDEAASASRTPASLRDILLFNLSDRSSLDEVKDYCFRLQVDFENLPGDTKVNKARELILFLERRSRLAELVGLGKTLRSDLAWESPGATPGAAPATAPMPQATLPPATSAFRNDTAAVGEGIDALIQLLDMPEVRDAISAFRTDFEAARKQIGTLRTYKQLHNLFQELELHVVPIEYDQQRLESDQALWDSLSRQVTEILETIAELVRLAGQAMLAAGEALWSNQLGQARQEMQQALDTLDAKPLESATNRVKRVLNREPSRINTRLVAAVEALRVADLAQRLIRLRDHLAVPSIKAAAIQTFADGAIALSRLDANFRAALADHNVWQAVDDELRRIDDNLILDTTELERGWGDVMTMTRDLFGGRTDDWAAALNQTGADLQSALDAKALPKARLLFGRYRSQASRRFRRIDDDLMTMCDDLQKVGESLDQLLAAME